MLVHGDVEAWMLRRQLMLADMIGGRRQHSWAVLALRSTAPS